MESTDSKHRSTDAEQVTVCEALTLSLLSSKEASLSLHAEYTAASPAFLTRARPRHRARPWPSFCGRCPSDSWQLAPAPTLLFSRSRNATFPSRKQRMATSNLNLRPRQLSHFVPTPDPSFRVSQSFMTDAWHVPLLPPPQGDWSITFRNGDQGRTAGRNWQKVWEKGRANIATAHANQTGLLVHEPQPAHLPRSIQQIPLVPTPPLPL